MSRSRRNWNRIFGGEPHGIHGKGGLAAAVPGEQSFTQLLRMSRDDLWEQLQRQFLSPTAAFPAILDNTIRKSIVQRYQSAPTTFQVWTTEGTLTDFKPSKDHEYLLGGAGEFLEVAEGGELKHDTLKTDLLPQRKLSTYGRQFSMTREAFVNDDIGLITEMPGQYAAAAKRTINKQVYQILWMPATGTCPTTPPPTRTCGSPAATRAPASPAAATPTPWRPVSGPGLYC